jgi:hypothetical protein
MKLAKKLLSLFVDRCKLHHGFAFMQFRRILPDADLDELKEIFTGRKAYIQKFVDKVIDLIGKGYIDRSTPMKQM